MRPTTVAWVLAALMTCCAALAVAVRPKPITDLVVPFDPVEDMIRVRQGFEAWSEAKATGLARPLFQNDTRPLTPIDESAIASLRAGNKYVIPILLDLSMLNSTVLEMHLEGKTYQLEGKVLDEPEHVTWLGSTSWAPGTPHGMAQITYGKRAGDIFGSMTLGSRVFGIRGGGKWKVFLIEGDPHATPVKL